MRFSRVPEIWNDFKMIWKLEEAIYSQLLLAKNKKVDFLFLLMTIYSQLLDNDR